MSDDRLSARQARAKPSRPNSSGQGPRERTVTPLLPDRGYLLSMRGLSRTAASVLAAGVLVMLGAGCGGGRSAAKLATDSTRSQQARGLVAFASCMRSHGVPSFPDPSSSGGIPKPAVVSAFQAVSKTQGDTAQNACNHLLPSGGLSGQRVQTITPQDQQDYLRAAACMRSHGFPSFPDPTFRNNEAHVNMPSSINQNSAQFTTAATICTKLIPAGLPGSHRT